MTRSILLILLALTLGVGASGCDPSTFFLLAPTVLKNLGGGGGGGGGEPFAETRNVADLRESMLAFINDARDDEGLPPLVASTQLHAVAQLHSNDMVDEDFVNHTGSDGSTTEDRVRDSVGEWSYLGENIAAGYSTVRKAHDAFMDSSENRQNILAEDATRVGVGFAFGDDENEFADGAYITVIFYAPK